MTDIFKPSSVKEASAIIAETRATGGALQCVGNGSKNGIGQLHHRPLKQITAQALTGITQYNPQELVFVANAGTPMSKIFAALEANNQRLIFEPADWSKLTGKNIDQTIGGIAATNMSGPRRYALGAARDSLLGVKFVNGLGEEIKNGGQVMKNVTGLDLVKLMAGSWGTLGFLTEVSFKVLPKIESETTLVAHGLTDAAATHAMAKAMGTSCDITGAAHLPNGTSISLASGSATLLRFEGLTGSVKDRIARLTAAMAGLEFEHIEDAKSAAAWSQIRDVAPFCDGTLNPVWRISCAPTQGHKIVETIQRTTNCDAFYDWQGGLIWLRINDENVAHETNIRAAIAGNGGGHAMLVRANDMLRHGVDVFQPEQAAVAALTARIRASIDPDGVFDGGRMVRTVSATKAA